MRLRPITFAAALAAVLLTTGCAASPDVSDLGAELSAVPGVVDARAAVNHPGAPWNTEIVVRMQVESSDDAALIGIVRDAAPRLADDPATARNGVTIMFFLGGQELDDQVYPSGAVYDDLGLEFGAGESIRMRPDDIERLAAASR